MARLQRTKAGSYTARKGIPKDVSDAYRALYGRAWEELFNLPSGQSPQKAKKLFSEWQAEIDNRIETLRAKQRGEGHDLTQRQAQALAGEWYRWFVRQHEDDAGEPRRWAQLAEVLTDAIMDATPWWDNNDPEFQHRDRAQEPDAREAIHPMLADEAKTAQFLASKGETLTPAAMEQFLDCLVYEFLAAVDLLRKRAIGDYTPDTHPQSFPEYVRERQQASSAKTCMDLFAGYIEATGLAAGTISRERGVFTTLDYRATIWMRTARQSG